VINQISVLSMLKRLALLIPLTLTGCMAAATSGYMAAQDRPVIDGVSDITAAQGLRNLLTRKDLDANSNDYAGVRIRVVDGLALLVGTVPTEGIKTEVETLSRAQPRIKTIVNDLKVSDMYGGASTDPWVAAKARAALSSVTGVRFVNYTLEVDNGRLYLMGRARNVAELGLAADAVARVSGVNEVISLVAVEAAPVAPAPATP